MPHGMELVVTGENLGDTAAGIPEDDEVFQQLEKPPLVEDPLTSLAWVTLGA
jgi:hypothetical protein